MTNPCMVTQTTLNSLFDSTPLFLRPFLMSSLPTSACTPSRRLQSLLAVQDQAPRSPPTSSPVNAVDSAWAELMGTATSSDDGAPAISPKSKTIRRAASSLHPGSPTELRDSLTGSGRRLGPAVRTAVVPPIQRSGSGLSSASRAMSRGVRLEGSSNIGPAMSPMMSPRHTAASSSTLASSATAHNSGDGNLASNPKLGKTTPAAETSEAGGGGGSKSPVLPPEHCPVELISASKIVPSATAVVPEDPDALSQQQPPRVPLLLQQEAPADTHPLSQQPSGDLGGLAWHEVEVLPIIDPITKQTVSQGAVVKGISAHTGVSILLDKINVVMFGLCLCCTSSGILVVSKTIV